MDKSRLKLIVDICMGLSFIVVALTGLFKWPSLIRKFYWVYNFVDFRTMSRIHDWSGALMALFVLIHLILNWPWIKSWFIKK